MCGVNIYMNVRYKKFKELGVCVRCGSTRYNGKTRCEKCHNEHLLYQSKAKNQALSQGKCRYCLVNVAEIDKSMCINCLNKHNEKQKVLYSKYRKLCIDNYGSKCVCCGLQNEKYLQLDHINNDGCIHRHEIFKSQKGSIYTWACRNKFPNNLQLLCANCHQAKTVGKPCTHEDHNHFVGLFGIG